ncbi:MAG: OmpH family outer membrane protein [Treponema sp.]|jgi:outer membrane protein|nr:OmpH family outer membrane protein [Treponema sp.]
MKKSIGLLFSALVFISGNAAAQQLTRFAVVDLSRVYTSFFRESAAVRNFEQRSARVQSDIDRMSAEINTLKASLANAEFEGNQSDISRFDNEIRRKSDALRDYFQTKTAELEREKARLTQSGSFLEQVYDQIRFLAESEGYTMVLNLKENTGILWHSPTVDITDKLIKSLLDKARR